MNKYRGICTDANQRFVFQTEWLYVDYSFLISINRQNFTHTLKIVLDAFEFS